MKHQRGAVSLHLVLTIFLGFGMVLFGVLAVLAYRDNTYVRNNLNSLISQAVDKAVTKQKKEDAEANRIANEQPYVTYTADGSDGSFQFQIPKGWSMYAGRNAAPKLQLDFAANPSVVTLNYANNGVNTHAFHVRLYNQGITETSKPYSDLTKKKDFQTKQPLLTSKAYTVSGAQGNWYEGQIDEQRHNGVAIVIPVRDKTMVISTDTRNYLPEFKKIVDSAKIPQ